MLRANQIDESEVTRLLAEFHHTWEAIAPRDQARVLELLIERIDYRGKEGQVSLTFRRVASRLSPRRQPYEHPLHDHP